MEGGRERCKELQEQKRAGQPDRKSQEGSKSDGVAGRGRGNFPSLALLPFGGGFFSVAGAVD